MSTELDELWDAFDPDAQAVLRPIMEHEFRRRLQPYYEAEADQQLRETAQRLAVKYKDFPARQQEVLQFAVDRNINDLEIAYHALRGATADQAVPASAAQSAEEAAENERREKRRARLEELRFKDDLSSRMERAKLENEEEEDSEAQAKKVFRGDSDGDELRRQIIEDANADADIANRVHRTRTAFGHHDSRRSGRAKTTEESRAEMDLEAIEVVRAGNRGEEYTPKTASRSPSRADYEADRDGLDRADRAVLAEIRSANSGSAA